MFRMKKKDMALVAFASGLLVFELAGLEAAAPTVLRTLAGITGIHQVGSATRGARVATESMLNGFSVAAAQAAAQEAAQNDAGAVEGAATQRVRPAYGYVLSVRDRGGASQRVRARLVGCRAGMCRADARTIVTHRGSDTMSRTIEITREGRSEATSHVSSGATSEATSQASSGAPSY